MERITGARGNAACRPVWCCHCRPAGRTWAPGMPVAGAAQRRLRQRRPGRRVAAGLHDTLALSEGRLLACVGVSDLVVVATPDAILVAHKDKHAGRQEDRRHPQAAQAHRGADPPQGVSPLGLVRQRGRRRAFPGQAHRGQAGWHLVAADAPPPRRTLDRGERHCQGDQGRRDLSGVGERIHLHSAGHHHRLENPGRVPLEMIEVQSGSYLGEDDIVRFEDVYGR
jgi:mannose-1-phosphate guanylyltransferase/mannose-6-phosphate isomerase